MADRSPTAPAPIAPPDRAQKRRLILGALVFAAGWSTALVLIPVVQSMDLSAALKATLSGILLLAVPKVFLVIAIALMGKPGFAYLKGLLAARFRRLKPPATVSPLRYRVGLVMFVTLIALGSIGPYVGDMLPLKQQHPQAVAMTGDLLLVVSLFVLGGDFWDKLRALFVREATVVFPPKQS